MDVSAFEVVSAVQQEEEKKKRGGKEAFLSVT